MKQRNERSHTHNCNCASYAVVVHLSRSRLAVLILVALFLLFYRLVPLGFIATCLLFLQERLVSFVGASRASVSVAGINITYLVRNPQTTCRNPPPTVVLVHGITVDKHDWLILIRHLPKSWKIIAPDLPGHGDSGFIEEDDYSTVGVEPILHQFFVTLGLRKFHLIGESLGALYSAHYASEHPDMLASLTLFCPPGLHRLEGGVATNVMKFLDDVTNHRDPTTPNIFLPQNGEEFRNKVNLVIHKPYWIPLRLLEAAVLLQRKRYPNFRKIMKDLASSDVSVEAKLKNISTPLQVIWGRHDKVCHISGVEVVKRIKKNARVTIIENCGHVLSMERPRYCSRLINDFVSTHYCSVEVY